MFFRGTTRQDLPDGEDGGFSQDAKLVSSRFGPEVSDFQLFKTWHGLQCFSISRPCFYVGTVCRRPKGEQSTEVDAL